jgi:hypothetical protein
MMGKRMDNYISHNFAYLACGSEKAHTYSPIIIPLEIRTNQQISPAVQIQTGSSSCLLEN